METFLTRSGKIMFYVILYGMPNYIEMMRQRDQTVRALQFSFFIINFYVIVINFGGAFIAKLNDILKLYLLDVAKLCHDSNLYYSPQPTSNEDFANWKIICAILLCTFLIKIKGLLHQEGNTYALLKRLFWECVILVMHLIFLYLLIDLLKMTAGMPRPYFSSNKILTNIYCKNKTDKKHLNTPLKIADEVLEMFFPSIRAAIYGFFFTYLSLYLYRIDIAGKFYEAQVLLILLSTQIFGVMYRSWLNGENHFMNILVGLLFGILQATFAIRSVFGKILRPRVTILKKHCRIQQDNVRPCPPPPPPTPVHYPTDPLSEDLDDFKPPSCEEDVLNVGHVNNTITSQN